MSDCILIADSALYAVAALAASTLSGSLRLWIIMTSFSYSEIRYSFGIIGSRSGGGLGSYPVVDPNLAYSRVSSARLAASSLYSIGARHS